MDRVVKPQECKFFDIHDFMRAVDETDYEIVRHFIGDEQENGSIHYYTVGEILEDSEAYGGGFYTDKQIAASKAIDEILIESGCNIGELVKFEIWW
jgi:hypothetical protein